MSSVDRGTTKAHYAAMDLSVSQDNSMGSGVPDDSLYLSPYSSHFSSARPSVDFSKLQPMHQLLLVDQQSASIVEEIKDDLHSVKIVNNQLSSTIGLRSAHNEHGRARLRVSHKGGADAPSPSDSFDSLRGIDIDIPEYTEPLISRTVDFDLVAAYLEDNIVSYLWTRLLAVRQQIEDFNT